MGEVKRYTQGVCMDGAAILLDGKMQTIEEILGALNSNADLVGALELILDIDNTYCQWDELAEAKTIARQALAKHRGE